MIWFTSDLHFGHENILKYEETRGFSTIEKMNEKLVENWNSVVKDEDIIYILGDFFMGSIDLIDKILPRLKGEKVLIRGNHDSNKRVEKFKSYGIEVYDMYNLKYDKKLFVLCHYPMREWLNKEHGSIHLYGHVHGSEHRNGFLNEKNSYHVGVDTNNLMPISIEEVINNVRSVF